MSLPMHWAEQLPISALQLRVNKVQPQARHAAVAGHALDAAPAMQPQPAAVLMDAFTCEQITTLQLLVSNAVRGACTDISLTPLQQQVAHTLLRGAGAAPFSTVQQLVDHAAMSGATDTLLKSLQQMVALAEQDRALNAPAQSLHQPASINRKQAEPHTTAAPPQPPRSATGPPGANQPNDLVQQAVTIPLIETGAAQSSSVQMPANTQTAASHGSRTAVLQPEPQTAAASSGAQGSHAHASSHAHAGSHAEQAMDVDTAPAIGTGTSQSTAVQATAQSTAEGPSCPTGAVAMGAASPALLGTTQQQQQQQLVAGQVWPVTRATAEPAAPLPCDGNGVGTAQGMDEDLNGIQLPVVQQPATTAGTTSAQAAQLNRPHQPQQPALAAPLGAANGITHAPEEDMREASGVSEAWKEQIQAALALANAPGTFACCGIVTEVPHLAPKVSIPGVARLAWPLCQEQAMKLMLAGEAVPPGPGTPDPAGGHAVQFDASRITIAPSWDPVMERVKNQALASLGVGEDTIKEAKARLSKLLLYPPGGHFMPRRDTEKEPGMFATLIVQLPAGHEGGALEVLHAGKQFVWDSALLSEEDIQYAAFYADCQHQLKPTTQGWRILLAYNLVCTSPGPLPCPVDGSQALDQLTAAVRAWEAAGTAAQDRVALQLEHQYTEKDLEFEPLKGKDATTVALLRACSLLDVHLELISNQMSVSTLQVAACPDQENTDHLNTDQGNSGGHRGKKRCWHGLENGADMHNTKASQSWLTPSGPIQSLCDHRLCDGHSNCHKKPRLANTINKELLPTDNGSHQLETGHRAMVLIWPRSRAAKLACQGDFGAGLHLLAQRLQAAKAAEHELQQRQAERAEQLRMKQLERVQAEEHSSMEGIGAEQGKQEMQKEEGVVEAAVTVPKATQQSALTASLPDELVEALPEQIAAILPYRHMLPLDQQMKVHQLILQIVQAHLPHLAASMGLEDTPASPGRSGTTPVSSEKPQDAPAAIPVPQDAPQGSPDCQNKEVSGPQCNGVRAEERAEAQAREEVLQGHQAQVLAVVEELAAMAEQAPVQCFPGAAAAEVHAVQLLKLLGDAAGLLDARLAEPASWLIHALASSEGLSSSAVIQSLGELTSAHDSGIVDAAVVALVGRCALSQTSQCVELALLPSLPERLQSQVSEAILRPVLRDGQFESVPAQGVATVARLACRSANTMSDLWAAVLARSDLLSVLPAMLREPALGQATATDTANMATKPVTGDTPSNDYAVMQLLCQVSGRVSGMDQAKQALEQAAIRSITAATGSVGVSSTAAGNALAALAAALDSVVVDAAIVALVRACSPRQTSQCVELAMLPSLPERLQRPLSEAALSVLKNGHFESLPIESVCTVARLACRTGIALDALCSALLARPDVQSVLAALLAEPVVREAVAKERANAGSTATMGPLASLVMARVHAQRAVLTWASTVSWAMPNASLPGYPQVEAFLRGPKQKETFRIFGGLIEAREFATQYFNGAQGSDYSATAVIGGRGANAWCEVTKTQEWQERKKKAAEVPERDIEQLLGLLGRTSYGPTVTPLGSSCGLAMSTLTGRPSVQSTDHASGPVLAGGSGCSPAPAPSTQPATSLPGFDPASGNRSGATPLAAPGLEFTIPPALQPHMNHSRPPHPPSITTASHVAALALSVLQGANPAHALGAARLAGVPAPRLSHPGGAMSGLNGLKSITNANGPGAHNLPGLETLALWLLATAEQKRQQQQQQARANSSMHGATAAPAPSSVPVTALPAALPPSTVPAVAKPVAPAPAAALATAAPVAAAPAAPVPIAAVSATALPAAATPAKTTPATAAAAPATMPVTTVATVVCLPTTTTPAETGVATPVTAATASTTTAAAAPSTSGITVCTPAPAAAASIAAHMADSHTVIPAGTSKPAETPAAEQPGGSVALLWSQLARKQKQQPRLQLKPPGRPSQATPSPGPSQQQEKAECAWPPPQVKPSQHEILAVVKPPHSQGVEGERQGALLPASKQPATGEKHASVLHPSSERPSERPNEQPNEQPNLAPPPSSSLLPIQGGQSTMTSQRQQQPQQPTVASPLPQQQQQQQPDLAAPQSQQLWQPQQPGLGYPLPHALLQGEHTAPPSLLLPPDGHQPPQEAAGRGQAPAMPSQVLWPPAEQGPSLSLPGQHAVLSPPPQQSEQNNSLSQPTNQQQERSHSELRAGVHLPFLPPVGQPQPSARVEGPQPEGEQPPPPPLLPPPSLQPQGLQPLGGQDTLLPPETRMLQSSNDQQLAPLSPQLHPYPADQQLAPLSPQLHPDHEHEQTALLSPQLQPYHEHDSRMPPLAALQPALQQQWSECELHAHLHGSCSEGQALLLSPQLHQSESEELTLSLPLQQEHNSPCKPLTPMSSPQRLPAQHTAPVSPQQGRRELQPVLVRQQPVNARPPPLSPSQGDLSSPTLLLRQQPVQHRPPPQLSQLMEHDMPTSPPAGQRQPSESEQNALSSLFMLLQQQDPAQPTPPSSQQASFQSDGQASWPLYPSWLQYQHSPAYGDPQQPPPGYPYNMLQGVQQPDPPQQAGNVPKKGKGKGKGKGKQPAEAPAPAAATVPPMPGTQQWSQQHWSPPQLPLQFPGSAGASAPGAGWPQQQGQPQAAQQLMAPGIMSPQLAHAMGVMQQTIMQLGGNGVSQLIGLGQLAVGCRVAVLRPFVMPQWREAMVLQLAATGIVVTYGGADSDMLAPNTMNTVVRIL